jgi:UDPglucose--hexose-1-phosphate uridylyltransferase
VPELRRDPVVGRWVIISTERSRRPSDFAAAPVRPRNSGPCVFCPGQESRTPEEILAVRGPGSAPNGPGWTLRVVPNKFPALRIGELEPTGEGVYDRMNGISAHEVIIETPDHSAPLAGLPETQVVSVLGHGASAWSTSEGCPLSTSVFQEPRRGPARQSVPRQLIATPIVPMMVTLELEGSFATSA